MKPRDRKTNALSMRPGDRSRGRAGPISHDQLQQAIAKYLKSGGRIEKLPEQKSVSSSLVGRRWSTSAVEIDPLN